MPCTCPIDKLVPRCDVDRRGATQIRVQQMRFVCSECNAEWNIQSVGARNSFMLKEKPTPAPKKKPATPAKVDRVQVTWDKLTGEWRANGGQIPDCLPPKLIYSFTTLKPDKSLLMLGAAGGLVPYVLDKGGAGHVVVTDDMTAIEAAPPRWQRTEFQPTSWRPEYGKLFNGIIIAEELTAECRQCLTTLLVPEGDCWLIGPAAQRYADELAAAWGYTPRVYEAGTPTEYRFFFGDDTPLGDGAGTELHDNISNMGMPNCQKCRKLARRMNAWEVAGCREHFDEIVEDILPRARDWWNNTDYRTKMRAWWKSNKRLSSAMSAANAVAAGELDEMLRDVIRQQVTTAINSAERKLNKDQP